MDLDFTTKKDVEFALNELMKESVWSYDITESALLLIQLHKLLQVEEIDESTFLDYKKKCRSFIHNGLKSGELHDVGTKQNVKSSSSRSAVVTAALAAGSTYSSLSVPLAALTPIASLGSFAALAPAIACAAHLVKPKPVQKIGSPEFIPAEVMIYAKKRGMWLDCEEILSNPECNFIEIKSSQINHVTTAKVQSSNKSDQSANNSSRINSKEASARLTDTQWGPSRVVKKQIEDMVLAEAAKTGCTCLPVHMRDYLMDKECDDGQLLINTSVITVEAALKHIKQTYKRHEIPRSCKGRPPINKCPIHSAKKRAKH